MRILVTGALGQLGNALTDKSRLFSHDMKYVDLPEVDITSADMVGDVINELRPELLINAAAYTNVDGAESHEDTAYSVNRDGAANLAEACASIDIPMIHISTDYVFNGQKETPYLATDPVSPLGVYGKSKLAGDDAVIRNNPRHVIIRTAWLYGIHGNNFVKTMMRIGRQREEVRVVDDQYGCPTCAEDFAEAIFSVADEIAAGNEGWGIYHYVGEGITTWFHFAEAVFDVQRKYEELVIKKVIPIPTHEYPTPTERPKYSALDCSGLINNFGIRLVPWRKSLDNTVQEILKQTSE